jgi:hypothetical protein
VTWRFSAVTGVSVRIPDGALGTSIPQGAATCIVNSKLELLGGGGEGIFLQYEDYHWREQDLETGVWTVGPSSWAPHDAALLSVNGSCLSTGGQLHLHSDDGTAEAMAFDPSTHLWSELPPLPMPVSLAAAAFDGTRVLVVGGWCSGVPGCPTGSLETFFANAWIMDVTQLNPTWTAVPDMPTSRISGFAVAYSGRFYLLGGAQDDSGQKPKPGLISWAPGDSAWQAHDATPMLSPRAAYADTQGIFVLQVTDSGDVAVFRWKP